MRNPQFPSVGGMYGAPMGRSESPLGETPKGTRVFRARLDPGGYDDGGAYWGLGKPLYCATCPEGGRQFVRADSRLSAIVKMGIRREFLRCAPVSDALSYINAKTWDLSAEGHRVRHALIELGY